MIPDPWTRTSYADTCMECMEHTLQPVRIVREGGQAKARYRCPCGHGWTTSWSVGAVEGWDLLDGDAAA